MSLNRYQFTQIKKQTSCKNQPDELNNGIVKQLLAKYQKSNGFNSITCSLNQEIEKKLSK